MSIQLERNLDRGALIARYLIVAAFGFALAAFWGGASSPDRAYAATPVSAAPSYLSFTAKVNGNSKFYITDTNRKVICVYSLVNDQLRLVSARKFDHDSKIRDASIKAPVPMEGIAATRDDAEQYSKSAQKVLSAVAKKYGQNPEGE